MKLLYTFLIAVIIYKTTAYCPCEICCSKYSDGYVASGKRAKVGYVACNHLDFGTKLIIEGKEYEVQDRGSKRYFGTKTDIKRSIDIYFDTHKEAKEYGVQYRKVTIK